MSISISKTVGGPLMVNTYYIHNDDSVETIVIDPSDGMEAVRFLQENGLTPVAVLLTHGHFDHIGGVYELKRRGAHVYIHSADAACLSDPGRSMALFVRQRQINCTPDFLLEDGDRMRIAGIEICVIHTPGHTNGGVAFVVPAAKTVFSGDTLFYDVFGNTEFEEGDANKIYHSIVDKLFALDEDYNVLPGHGEPTTIKREKQMNAILKWRNV